MTRYPYQMVSLSTFLQVMTFIICEMIKFQIKITWWRVTFSSCQKWVFYNERNALCEKICNVFLCSAQRGFIIPCQGCGAINLKTVYFTWLKSHRRQRRRQQKRQQQQQWLTHICRMFSIKSNECSLFVVHTQSSFIAHEWTHLTKQCELHVFKCKRRVNTSVLISNTQNSHATNLTTTKSLNSRPLNQCQSKKEKLNKEK